MKTNVPIELSDEQRNRLAQVLDGKPTKRLAARAEVVDTCRIQLAVLIDVAEPVSAPERRTVATTASRFAQADAEDKDRQSKRFFSRREAAGYLTELGIPVKPNTLARWACAGRYALPMIKVGRIVRYDIRDLDAFAERHRVEPDAGEEEVDVQRTRG